jgi:hypothetical protein
MDDWLTLLDRFEIPDGAVAGLSAEAVSAANQTCHPILDKCVFVQG